ncbi:unnamed protein product, partial [Discosporangium mesarthrocarpum]
LERSTVQALASDLAHGVSREGLLARAPPRVTPSYVRVPRDWPAPPCSSRTVFEARVLNDNFVGIGGGGTGFRHAARNPAEETLFRLEDERHALDAQLDGVAAVAARLEPLQEELWALEAAATFNRPGGRWGDGDGPRGRGRSESRGDPWKETGGKPQALTDVGGVDGFPGTGPSSGSGGPGEESAALWGRRDGHDKEGGEGGLGGEAGGLSAGEGGAGVRVRVGAGDAEGARVMANFPFLYELDKRSLTQRHLGIIRGMYPASQGRSVVRQLRENPVDALPMVLKHLRRRQRDLSRARSEQASKWRSTLTHGALQRALDQRSSRFRLEDRSSIATRPLLLEIKQVKGGGGGRGRAKAKAGAFPKTVGEVA